jgi:hypothetical protein
VPRAPKSAFDLNDAAMWDALPTLNPFWRADGKAVAEQQTQLRVCFDERVFYARFDCADRDIWGTYTQRDEPIYEQEVVEVFIGAGMEDLIHYFEFQVSPNGVLFDSKVYNPTGLRADASWDIAWNCPDLRWHAERNDAAQTWWAAFAIPWQAIMPDGQVPDACRANFYRIERPRNAEPEYSCLSPTMTEPADFHKPPYCGILEFQTRSRP